MTIFCTVIIVLLFWVFNRLSNPESPLSFYLQFCVKYMSSLIFVSVQNADEDVQVSGGPAGGRIRR